MVEFNKTNDFFYDIEEEFNSTQLSEIVETLKNKNIDESFKKQYVSKYLYIVDGMSKSKFNMEHFFNLKKESDLFVFLSFLEPDDLYKNKLIAKLIIHYFNKTNNNKKINKTLEFLINYNESNLYITDASHSFENKDFLINSIINFMVTNKENYKISKITFNKLIDVLLVNQTEKNVFIDLTNIDNFFKNSEFVFTFHNNFVNRFLKLIKNEKEYLNNTLISSYSELNQQKISSKDYGQYIDNFFFFYKEMFKLDLKLENEIECDLPFKLNNLTFFLSKEIIYLFYLMHHKNDKNNLNLMEDLIKDFENNLEKLFNNEFKEKFNFLSLLLNFMLNSYDIYSFEVNKDANSVSMIDKKTFISKNFDYIVKNGNEIEEELIKKIYTKILNQILKKFELNSLSNDDELKLNYFSDKISNDKLELIAQLKHFHNECILCDKYLNNEFNTM